MVTWPWAVQEVASPELLTLAEKLHVPAIDIGPLGPVELLPPQAAATRGRTSQNCFMVNLRTEWGTRSGARLLLASDEQLMLVRRCYFDDNSWLAWRLNHEHG